MELISAFISCLLRCVTLTLGSSSEKAQVGEAAVN